MSTHIDPTKLTGDWKTWAEEADKADENNAERKDGILLNSAFEVNYVKEKAKASGKTDDEIKTIFKETGLDGGYVDGLFVEHRQNAPEQSKAKKADRKYALEQLRYRAAEQLKYVDFNYDKVKEIDTDERDEKLNTVKNTNVDINAIVESINNDLALQGLSNVLGSKVKEVAIMVENYNQPLNSKESIRAMFTTLSKSIKGDDKSFKKDVLATLVGAIEAFQRTKEQTEMTFKYSELRNSGKSRTEAYKELKQMYGNKGSYYSEVLKDFENNVVMLDAQDDVTRAIDRQRIGYDADGDSIADVTTKNALTSGKKIEKAIKNDKELEKDKYTKKVMRGRGELTASEKINFERSSYKAYRKAAASDNRVAINKDRLYTKEDITNELRHDEVFNHLLAKGFIESKNGKFDITKLSDEIGKKVGADNVLNRQKKKEITFDEMYHIIDSIVATGTTDGNIPNIKLKKHDVIALAELCGYEYDGKNFFLALWKNTVGGLADMAVSVVTAAATEVSATAKYVGNRNPVHIDIPFQQDVPVKVEVINNTNLKFTFKTNSPEYVNINSFQFLKDLMRQNGLTSDQVVLETLENGFTVTVNKSDVNFIEFTKHVTGVVGTDVLPEDIAELDNVEANPEKDVTKGLLAGLGLTLLILALKAALEDNKGEIGVIPTQFDNESMTYDKYIGTLASQEKDGRMTKQVAAALTQLASMYAEKDENGKVISWDKDKYKAFLNRIAGDQSHLNKHELLNGLKKILADMRNVRIEKIEETTEVDETPVLDDKVRAEQDESRDFTPTPNYNKGNKHTWQGIIKTIYGDWKNEVEYMALVHAIKDANGIKYGDNVIPANLYFPDDLFGDRNRMSKLNSYSTPVELEKAMKKNDIPVDKADSVISNGTRIRAVKINGKWRGIREWYENGQLTASNRTGYDYDDAETAKREAKKLQKPE